MTADELDRSDNGSGTCGEDCPECPLCMEPLDLDDLSFYPCTCGYQVCKFCWHRMKTNENGLCPACRQKYPDDPVDFKPVATEEMQKFKSNKKQRNGQKKKDSKEKIDRIIDSRKHLATIRVVQKNLVFVIGLPPKLTDPEVLKRTEYFGKFGKIIKVMVNTLNANGTPASSASAYITYQRSGDSLRAIQTLNNLHIDGRVLKASLGTTKYCVNFLKNQLCSKTECMYLHDHGDEAASFTKEEMQQGKHQEYEKALLDSLSPQLIQPAAPMEIPGQTAAGSLADSLVSTSMERNRVLVGSAVSLPRGSSPSSVSSLSSSSASLDEQMDRASPSASFDLFVDTFEEFGFDPWNESSKGLADLMEMESRSRAPPPSYISLHRIGHYQQHPQPFGYGMQPVMMERPRYHQEAEMGAHPMYVQRRQREYEMISEEMAQSGPKWPEAAHSQHFDHVPAPYRNFSTGNVFQAPSGDYGNVNVNGSVAFQNSRLSVQ